MSASTGQEGPPAELDPYDPDDAMHVDDIPDYNGDRRASFAFDDAGTRYKVVAGDRIPRTYLIPEESWRETWMPKRPGVGEPCAGCDNKIEWDAIIVRSGDQNYHARCFPGGEASG